LLTSTSTPETKMPSASAFALYTNMSPLLSTVTLPASV